MNKKIFISATSMLAFDPVQLMKQQDANSKDFNEQDLLQLEPLTEPPVELEMVDTSLPRKKSIPLRSNTLGGIFANTTSERNNDPASLHSV